MFGFCVSKERYQNRQFSGLGKNVAGNILLGWLRLSTLCSKIKQLSKSFSFLYFIAQNYLYDCNCHLTFRKSLSSCINYDTNLNILKLQQFMGSLLNTTPFTSFISFHSILKKENKKNVCNDLTKDSSIILWNVLGFPSFVT